jgi:hypothetical protein
MNLFWVGVFSPALIPQCCTFFFFFFFFFSCLSVDGPTESSQKAHVAFGVIHVLILAPAILLAVIVRILTFCRPTPSSQVAAADNTDDKGYGLYQ